ncbi:facilitated trehalose transporter Tret1-2 homolog isoform X2 [Thrips palmi]|uniref:Facilitated trehalose transporter Tret1-2 homolog isoform X2 n=1 Tax=Thrips palmi TaxID=161013 RepID=A0A6P8ZML8_THRPL|nr:facilitated trehalose transporter Tret1-2 homolog isoform X2 [Thrips palmi]
MNHSNHAAPPAAAPANAVPPRLSGERRNSAAKWSLSTIAEADRAAILGKKKWPQHVAALAATLTSLVGGAVLGWTSPVLDELHLMGPSGSWVASLAPLGALGGAALSGWLARWAGRKPLILALVIPNVAGWSVLVAASGNVSPSLCHSPGCASRAGFEVLVAPQIDMLYAGRLLTGLCAGAATVLVPMYSAEISEPAIRGTIGVYLDLSLTVGILMAYVVGGLAGQVYLSGLCGALSLVAAITFFFMPESPQFLVVKGRRAEAEDALRWLRTGSSAPTPKGSHRVDVSAELDAMTRLAVESEERERASGGILGAVRGLCGEGSVSPTSRAVVLVVMLMALQQLSGIDAIIFFLQSIFKKSDSSLEPMHSTIVVGSVQVAATLVAALLVERAGRRLLLGVSGSLMAASLAALLVYFLFHKELDVDLNAFSWLPVSCLSAFVFVYCIGFGPLPFLMMAEFLPLEARSWGCGLAACVNWSLMFVVVRVFNLLMNNIGEAATFGIFCAICILGTLFVLTLVPETQGKTPAEIRQYLQDREIHTVTRRVSTPGGVV